MRQVDFWWKGHAPPRGIWRILWTVQITVLEALKVRNDCKLFPQRHFIIPSEPFSRNPFPETIFRILRPSLPFLRTLNPTPWNLDPKPYTLNPDPAEQIAWTDDGSAKWRFCTKSTEYIHIYVCKCICIYIYVCVYVFVYLYVCIYIKRVEGVEQFQTPGVVPHGLAVKRRLPNSRPLPPHPEPWTPIPTPWTLNPAYIIFSPEVFRSETRSRKAAISQARGDMCTVVKTSKWLDRWLSYSLTN